MKRLRGFTLAEVLITLAIIGVVAALTIPSVISNSQQQEFKTGLRKAVSVLNSAITMNMAIDGESPYENADLFNYLQRHMSIIKSSSRLSYYVGRAKYNKGTTTQTIDTTNFVFYTNDGMRFEMDTWDGGNKSKRKLHESNVSPCIGGCNGCGSYGLNDNYDNTTKPPCLIMVDVNGDKKPSPSNASCTNSSCSTSNYYILPNPSVDSVTDIFGILITDKKAVPYGVVAQKAMYQAQAKK